MKNILFTLVFLFFNAELSAQNFSGSWGYEIDGTQITLYGDKISNQNNGGRTGSLKVAVYATDYPYSGGYLNGYKLYEFRLDPLDAGYYYSNLSKTGWCTYPPDGSYSITILLLQYSYSDYEIVDYVTMDGYTRF